MNWKLMLKRQHALCVGCNFALNNRVAFKASVCCFFLSIFSLINRIPCSSLHGEITYNWKNEDLEKTRIFRKDTNGTVVFSIHYLDEKGGEHKAIKMDRYSVILRTSLRNLQVYSSSPHIGQTGAAKNTK